MRSKLFALLLLLVPVLGTAGCGGFFARRMAQAPNTYPAWLAPKAQVELAFSWKSLTNFPADFVDVGPPQARLAYRVVEPADYRVAVSSTNWSAAGSSSGSRWTLLCPVERTPGLCRHAAPCCCCTVTARPSSPWRRGRCAWRRKAGVACSWTSADTANPPDDGFTLACGRRAT